MKADAGIQERIGHLAATLAEESCYVCYRRFAATPSYPERNPDTAQRFVNGYGRARRWVAESAATAVAECIAAPAYSPITPTTCWRKASGAARRLASGLPARASAGRVTTGCATPSSPAAWRGSIILTKASCARSLRNERVAFLFRWFG